MRTWRIAASLALVASVSWAIPVGSQTLGLYDNFNSGVLNGDRWLGYEYSISKYDSHPEHLYGTPDWEPYGNPTNLASMRRVVGGQAQIALTSYRAPGEGYDERGAKARSGLRVNHVALSDSRPVVTALQARVTVVSASVPTPDLICHWNDLGTARAELFGHFFNDGTSTGMDDLTGDVFALVRLSRQVQASTSGAEGVLRNIVETQTGRCNNPDCSRVRWGSTTTFERTWAIGEPHVLTIVWRPATDVFVFTVAGGGVRESHTVPYTMADTIRARAYACDLRVETRPRRCYTEMGAANLVPQHVSIDARFDNVRINSSAATATR